MGKPRQPSMYAPVWSKLKLGEVVKIEALPRHHARIKRMVSKFKDEDLPYKLSNKLAGRFMKLHYNVDKNNSSILIIQLVQENLSLEDLL